MIEPELLAAARRCLPDLDGTWLGIARLPGGGNNRLYAIEAADRRIVLKHYFRHPDQPRDRLGAEFAFLARAWAGGVRCIPEPLGKDEAEGVGCYGWVSGRRLARGEVGLPEVQEALDFLAAVNRPATEDAPAVGPASEACFSVQAHVDVLDGRIARLLDMDVRDDLDADAARFVRDQLAPAWHTVRASTLDHLRTVAPAWAQALAPADRVVSPSDFGFHNALRGDDGRLAFLDFEYGGWDDPAKLVCDFFFQPAVPVPPECFETVVRGVAALVADGTGLAARVALLRPLVGLKWCCIVLNHFSAVDGARRAFAATSASNAKAGQLAKARRMLARVVGPQGRC